jgi:general secretion pathway protein A
MVVPLATLTPFSISPNPNCLYITPSIKAVLAKTKFCIDKRQGLNTVMGDVGLGKSTILRYLHAEYDARDEGVTTLVPTPVFSSEFALLKSIAQDFGLPPKASLLAQMELMQSFLVEQFQNGKHVIVFIDEAQKLTPKMLELIRGLLNYETNEVKLLQIVLAAQLELRDKLLHEKNKPLYSRVIAPSTLDPLTLEETVAMIDHRIKFAGIKETFSEEAKEEVYYRTHGVPRNILKLCALAYEMAQMTGDSAVILDHIIGAAEEYGMKQVAEAEVEA